MSERLSQAIALLAQGDEEAVCQLNEVLTPKLKVLALSITGNPADAEDVVQETFAAILAHCDSYRREENLAGWIYQIARHKAYDVLRSRRGLASGRELESLPGDFSLDSIDDRLLLVQMAAPLHDDERYLLVLRYGGNLTLREMSQFLRQPVSTLNSKLKRILKKFQLDGERPVDKREKPRPLRLEAMYCP